MACIKFLLRTAPLLVALELAIAPSIAAQTEPPSWSIGPFSFGRSSSIALAQPGQGEKAAASASAASGLAVKADTHATSSVFEVEDSHLKQSSPPPPSKNPGSSASGGRRDQTACPQDDGAPIEGPSLAALSPTGKSGLTLAKHPTFLAYVPKTSAKTAEFSLRSRNGSGIYRTTFALTSTPGVVRISLPPQAPPLEIGKQYTWSVAMICNPNDRIDDRFVTGSIQRTELDPTQLRQIQQAPPKERVSLYQAANVWYDAIVLLLELQRTQPHDPSINAMWREFLQSGGLDIMIDNKLSQENSR